MRLIFFCKFFLLLKRQTFSQIDNNSEIRTQEWSKAVKKATKSSASCIASTKDYSVHTCTLNSERIKQLLIRFHNLILKHNHSPKRWLHVADAMLEKVKAQKINRLRILELIKTEIQLLMRIFLGLIIYE